MTLTLAPNVGEQYNIIRSNTYVATCTYINLYILKDIREKKKTEKWKKREKESKIMR